MRFWWWVKEGRWKWSRRFPPLPLLCKALDMRLQITSPNTSSAVSYCCTSTQGPKSHSILFAYTTNTTNHQPSACLPNTPPKRPKVTPFCKCVAHSISQVLWPFARHTREKYHTHKGGEQSRGLGAQTAAKPLFVLRKAGQEIPFKRGALLSAHSVQWLNPYYPSPHKNNRTPPCRWTLPKLSAHAHVPNRSIQQTSLAKKKKKHQLSVLDFFFKKRKQEYVRLLIMRFLFFFFFTFCWRQCNGHLITGLVVCYISFAFERNDGHLLSIDRARTAWGKSTK